jgi:hypothetical protein
LHKVIDLFGYSTRRLWYYQVRTSDGSTSHLGSTDPMTVQWDITSDGDAVTAPSDVAATQVHTHTHSHTHTHTHTSTHAHTHTHT